MQQMPKLTKLKKSVDGEPVYVFALPSGAYTCMKRTWLTYMGVLMDNAEEELAKRKEK